MKIAATFLICAAGLAFTACTRAPESQSSTAQTKNTLIPSSKAIFSIAKNDVLKSADKIPDEVWSFQPTPEVRTVAQLFAHVADGQYEFCGPANGEKVAKDIEKTVKTKAEIAGALKDAFAYCDAVFAKMTDASATEEVDLFGRKLSRLAIMDFNTAHTMEHYGNLVTYMRIKGIVPPSSEGQK
jgi:uncharacterized damage-inducible protein DinB